MLPYVIRRLAQVVPVLLFASAVVFLMIYLVPGDQALAVLCVLDLVRPCEHVSAQVGESSSDAS